MPRIKVGAEGAEDVEIVFEDHGRGSPVVLLHPFPLSRRCWAPHVDPLVQAGYRVIAPDRRGFGDSSKPQAGYDFDTFAADLHALMETLDLRGAALVGFSMGGGEVVRYLATYGAARVARAVLVAAVPPYFHRTAEHPEGAVDDAGIAGMQAAVTRDRQAFIDFFLRGFFSAGGRQTVSDEERQAAATWAASASDEALLQCIGAFTRTDFRGDLARVTVPTLVLHGDLDALAPLEVTGRRSAQAIEHSTLEIIPGAPHGLTWSHPDEFRRTLLAFLAR